MSVSPGSSFSKQCGLSCCSPRSPWDSLLGAQSASWSCHWCSVVVERRSVAVGTARLTDCARRRRSPGGRSLASPLRHESSRCHVALRRGLDTPQGRSMTLLEQNFFRSSALTWENEGEISLSEGPPSSSRRARISPERAPRAQMGKPRQLPMVGRTRRC